MMCRIVIILIHVILGENDVHIIMVIFNIDIIPYNIINCILTKTYITLSETTLIYLYGVYIYIYIL